MNLAVFVASETRVTLTGHGVTTDIRRYVLQRRAGRVRFRRDALPSGDGAHSTRHADVERW